MKKFQLAVAGFVGVFLLSGVSTVSAQQPRYSSPSGSTLPHELNYFRRDVGVLDPYNGIVAPSARINSNLQALGSQQKADLKSVQRSIAQLREAQASPTGKGAGFMIRSHYYSTLGSGSR